MEPVVVFISLFVLIFGVSYLYYTTRNKERMALIERDKDVSIFMKERSSKTPPVYKIVLLTLGMLAIGIGLGVFLGSISINLGMENEVAYPAAIFLMAGIGLLVSFFMIKKLE
jgi:hypothetical protein